MEEELMDQRAPKTRPKIGVPRHERGNTPSPTITFAEARREAHKKADELLGQVSRELSDSPRKRNSKRKNA
jgi:hypothetical protein